jgi:hypothetical protein
LAVRRNGFPKTPEEAVQIANKALEEVDAEFKRYAPQRREIRPVTDVASTRSTVAPKTALEAAYAGLRRTG